MVEKVTIEKFKSKDGSVHDTLEKAERADKAWQLKQNFNAEKEVAAFQKMCENNFIRRQKRIDAGKSNFPSFWVTEQKYGQDYYMCNSFDDMEQMGWEAFQMWYDYYVCSDDQTVAIVELIKETGNKKAALAFVFDRTSMGYEYESMEEIHMTTFGNDND